MNKVTLLGRLTKDVDIKTSASGKAIGKFTLAVNRSFTKKGEEKQADFFNIIAFGATAEFCGKYFMKGLQVAVCGKIQNRSWDDSQGVKHYVTEILADEVFFAESKKPQAGMFSGADESPAKQPLFPASDDSNDGNFEDELPF